MECCRKTNKQTNREEELSNNALSIEKKEDKHKTKNKRTTTTTTKTHRRGQPQHPGCSRVPIGRSYFASRRRIRHRSSRDPVFVSSSSFSSSSQRRRRRRRRKRRHRRRFATSERRLCEKGTKTFSCSLVFTARTNKERTTRDASRRRRRGGGGYRHHLFVVVVVVTRSDLFFCARARLLCDD